MGLLYLYLYLQCNIRKLSQIKLQVTEANNPFTYVTVWLVSSSQWSQRDHHAPPPPPPPKKKRKKKNCEVKLMPFIANTTLDGHSSPLVIQLLDYYHAHFSVQVAARLYTLVILTFSILGAVNVYKSTHFHFIPDYRAVSWQLLSDNHCTSLYLYNAHL